MIFKSPDKASAIHIQARFVCIVASRVKLKFKIVDELERNEKLYSQVYAK